MIEEAPLLHVSPDYQNAGRRDILLGAVPEESKQELLRKVVQWVGLTEVALALKSPPELVSAWMSGHASMPDRKLLMLADFLDRFGRPEKG